MLKKFLGLILLLFIAVVHLYSVPFTTSDNTVTCIGGKSSGSFISELVLCDSDGYYATLNKDIVYKFIKTLNCKKVYIEEICGITNYYLYTDKLPKKQVLKGKKVNLHLAVKGDSVTLGYPFIYGSY